MSGSDAETTVIPVKGSCVEDLGKEVAKANESYVLQCLNLGQEVGKFMTFLLEFHDIFAHFNQGGLLSVL